jgi:Xaa-Pro aminopeptidase
MENLKRIQNSLVECDIPALLVSEIENVRWLTGFTGSSGAVVVTPSKASFITDARYDVQARDEVKAPFSVYIFATPKTMNDEIADCLDSNEIAAFGFEAIHTSYAAYQKLVEKFPNHKVQPAPDLFGPLRMVKSEAEIEITRRACKLADACFDHVCRLIQPGVSEYDLGLEIEFFFRRQGAKLAFEPIVVAGERAALPHGKPSERKLQPGDLVTMDFGANLDGYCSDLTRTVAIGEVTPRVREIYDKVLTAQEAALAVMKPGVSAAAVDKAARDAMGEDAKYFGHGLGHGLGRVVHDGGRLGPSSTDTLAVGQIWTVEPGIYVPGLTGCRIEDDVVVTPDGIEILTHSPKAFTQF